MDSFSKVLVIAQQLRRKVPGGIGTYTQGLLSGLSQLNKQGAKNGIKVSVFASRGPKNQKDPLAEYGFELKTTPLPAKVMTALWNQKLLGPPRGYELTHSTSLAFPVSRTSFGASPKLCVTIYDLAWRKFPQGFTNRGKKWHESALQRAIIYSDILIVPSSVTANELIEQGVQASKIEVIEAGCDHLPAPDDIQTQQLLTQLGIKDQYILTVSTLEPRKNLSRLIQAHKLALRQGYYDYPLVVVGPRGWGEDLEASEGILKTGKVTSGVLSGLYSRALCMAYVPLFEGFGLPAVEAMVFGTPVVASKIPSTKGACFEVDPLDIDSIAKGLAQVCRNTHLQTELIEAGLTRASQLSWRKSAQEHLIIWQGLANE